MELREIVSEYQTRKMEIASSVGKAKSEFSKKDYKKLIDNSGLSKDQISLSLKRYQLHVHGFKLQRIADFADKQIKNLTKKIIFKKDPLIEALYNFRDSKISYDEFLMTLDMFKVVKTDDEKAITKAKSLAKFLTENTIQDETQSEITTIVIPYLKIPKIPEQNEG